MPTPRQKFIHNPIPTSLFQSFAGHECIHTIEVCLRRNKDVWTVTFCLSVRRNMPSLHPLHLGHQFENKRGHCTHTDAQLKISIL